MSEPIPTATFEIRSTQLPSPPRTYSFQVFLEGNPVSVGYEFLWNLGDGATSNSPNPNHTYTNTGSFQVEAEVYEIDPKPDPEGENKDSKQPPPFTLIVT